MLKELKKFRIEHDLKSKEMAEKLGITKVRYSNIENGKVKVPSEVIFKFKDIFGVNDPSFYFRNYD